MKGTKRKYVTLSTETVQPAEQCGQSPFSKDLRSSIKNLEELADHLKDRAKGVSRLLDINDGEKNNCCD